MMLLRNEPEGWTGSGITIDEGPESLPRYYVSAEPGLSHGSRGREGNSPATYNMSLTTGFVPLGAFPVTLGEYGIYFVSIVRRI